MRISRLVGVGLGLIGFAASVPTKSGSKHFFYKGHDLSSLKMLEDGETKAVFRDTARGNAIRRAEDILADGGMNAVRLRLWVNPIPGQYDLSYVLELASRMHAAGHAIYLDFHFSDTWADPSHNNAPEAWPTKLKTLAATLRAYVSSTLHAFDAAGVPPAIVSLGNEVRNGMLWPLGRVDVNIEPEAARFANFTRLATLFRAARHGVHDYSHARGGRKRPTVMIHMDNGWNTTLQERWFSALTGTGLVKHNDWDAFGFSFYPFYGTEATFDNLAKTLDWAADAFPGKALHVAETDFPTHCSGKDAPELSESKIAISAGGQTAWARQIEELVRGVKGGVGRGVWYWEPAWLNLTSLGSTCQDALLFRQDWSRSPRVTGYSRPSVNMFLDSK